MERKIIYNYYVVKTTDDLGNNTYKEFGPFSNADDAWEYIVKNCIWNEYHILEIHR